MEMERIKYQVVCLMLKSRTVWAIISIGSFPHTALLSLFFLKREGSIKTLRFILQVKAHLPHDASTLKEACFTLEGSREGL